MDALGEVREERGGTYYRSGDGEIPQEKRKKSNLALACLWECWFGGFTMRVYAVWVCNYAIYSSFDGMPRNEKVLGVVKGGFYNTL